jgi:predicted DNA binding CopG/RHH family protein
MRNKKQVEIKDYDKKDTTFFIDKSRALRLKDLDIELPEEEPTKIVSMRLPTDLLNKIKAYASQQDVPYSSLIKILLKDGIEGRYKGL